MKSCMDETEKENEKKLLRKKRERLIIFLLALAVLSILYQSTLISRNDAIIFKIDEKEKELNCSKELIVVVMSAKWDEKRRNNSKQICQYFSKNKVKCESINSIDGRNLSTKRKQHFIEQGYIHHNFVPANKSTKIATAVTKIMAMQLAIDLKRLTPNNDWKYVLLLEDDALIDNNFLKHLQHRFFELQYYLKQYNIDHWDLFQLFGRQWCNPWNLKKRLRLKYLGHSIYQYQYGFALFTAILSPISSVQTFLDHCLPFQFSSDLWFGHFVRNGFFHAFLTCPPIVGEIGGPSLIFPHLSHRTFSVPN
ncbi:hypothetical protein RFI_14991 [Reticulomyxa filosa]|uniref:Uncharacterized protein n=1 Tax=Reticulomyxa filosa TaxID=46433 RepID=X6N820_RETFI|nr:hypothetical protein RFI_14991 [Reticulomyxa filosa]|eukprot:ETO22211.1 hypothetical protein RFI_14991 [Reticulomyxa filosa]